MENDENNDKRTEQNVSKAVRQSNKSSLPQNSNLSKAESSLHVMPAFEDILKDKTIQSPTLHSFSDGAAHPPVAGASEKEFISQMVEKISRSQRQDRSGEMPSLDLAKQILAQQRKIAALKRKSPGQEMILQPAQIKPTPLKDMTGSMPQAPASPQHLIIADIVAKEITALVSAR